MRAIGLGCLAVLLAGCATVHHGLVAASRDLPRSAPEAEGVSSAGIVDFLDAVAASEHEFHSLMLVRHGKVIAEGWWAPYAPDLKHTMYSASKSFTSTAIGFAVSEGKLSVDDTLVSIFPEDAPETIDPYLAALTVQDVLSMSVGQEPDPTRAVIGETDNWVEGFLATPIQHEPGTVFLYNSLGSHVLSAIVTQVTGQSAEDYLQPRLFAPLGIEGIDWETDPLGNSTGGWGLRLKTKDMAKFGQLLLQRGMWNGERVLSEAWIDEATTFKIQQSPDAPAEERALSDWMQGYGYQFWICRNDAFRGDGAFGQYIVVMPELDAVLAITSETPNMQGVLDLVWEHLLPAMHDGALPRDDAATGRLQATLRELALPIPSTGIAPVVAKTISGKEYFFEANAQNLAMMEFEFRGDDLEVTFNYGETEYEIPMDAGEWEMSRTRRKGPYLVARARNSLEGIGPFKVACAYEWLDDNTLELTMRYIESPHTEQVVCRFDGAELIAEFKPGFPGAPAVVLRGTATN